MERSKRILIPILALSVILFSSLACNSGRQEERDNLNATDTAIAGTSQAYEETIEALNLTLTPASTATKTPDCAVIITDPLGNDICQPKLFDDPETPEPSGAYYTVSSNNSWVNYYYGSGTKAGQVANGTSWKGSRDSFSLKGWIPEKDLFYSSDNTDTGTTSCEYHTWGHRSDLSLCHTHIFSDNGEVLATIAENLEFTAVGAVSNRYVPNRYGTSTITPGRVVEIEGTFSMNSN
jgi:hypothetical protein